MNNINLNKNIMIIGDDTVRIESLVNDYKTLARNNNYDIIIFDIERSTEREISELLYTAPMFSDGKLIIIKKLDKKKESEIEGIINSTERIDSKTKVIIVMVSISNELLSKVKKSDIKIVELKSLKYSELHKYVRDKYKDVIKLIGDSIVNSLFDVYGNDLPMIDSEMRKLSILIEDGSYDKNDPERLIPQIYIERVIYKVIDEILDGNRDNALRFISTLKEYGVDINQILALLQNLFARLMLIKISNVWDEKEASKITGLHQYVAKRYLKYSQSITYKKLKDTINKLIRIDYLMKEGKVVGFQGLFQVIIDIV